MVDEVVQLGWKVPIGVRDSFATFSNKMGTVIQEDCAGALMIWPYLPAEIREQAKLAAKGLVEIDSVLWDEFHAGLRKGLKARGNTPPKKRANKK